VKPTIRRRVICSIRSKNSITQTRSATAARHTPLPSTVRCGGTQDAIHRGNYVHSTRVAQSRHTARPHLGQLSLGRVFSCSPPGGSESVLAIAASHRGTSVARRPENTPTLLRLSRCFQPRRCSCAPSQRARAGVKRLTWLATGSAAAWAMKTCQVVESVADDQFAPFADAGAPGGQVVHC
jgi:hypothetical protein